MPPPSLPPSPAWPGRHGLPQVKKGLEKLYRRVEKDVSEEVLEVVWGAMQEAFMEQFRRFQVRTCSTRKY